ncbi:MAG: SH3 domain-containing protein [Anaerolineae bacterium]|nr:SH3 domain-containing protein [Anaerolineae bacterium]
MLVLKRISILVILTILSGACSLRLMPAPAPTTVIEGAPRVEIITPAAGAAYMQGVNVYIQALISNAGGDIDRIEISVDDALLQTLRDPNPEGLPHFSIQFAWPAEGIGEHTAQIVAIRGDDTTSEPASVQFRVVGENGGDSTAEATPETTETATPTAAQTSSPAPTTAPPTVVTGQPTATFTQSANVRSGPGLIFAPPIGAIAAGQTAEVLAVNPSATWYKVRYGSGEGWVSAALIAISGDSTSLPVDPGPPQPTNTPAPPTLPPLTTNTPQSSANLVPGLVVLLPSQPVCDETFIIGFDIANVGTEATIASGSISVSDTRQSDGAVVETTVGGFPILQAGETFRAEMPFTVNAFYEEDHVLTLVIDPNNQIAEANESDNRTSLTFRLVKGSCP